MKRVHTLWLVAALLVSGCASDGYNYGVSVDISNAPPPPRLVFYERPTYIASLSGGVYVVDSGNNDCDMFRYGSSWYVYTGSYWYRSRSYSGPYTVISIRSVPDRILDVPDRHWRHPHGGPPGQMKKRGRDWSS